jgi:hypothetical protein
MGWRCSFKRLSQDGGRADFLNLCASLFKKGLSHEPNFSQIHLAGQNLYSPPTQYGTVGYCYGTVILFVTYSTVLWKSTV